MRPDRRDSAISSSRERGGGDEWRGGDLKYYSATQNGEGDATAAGEGKRQLRVLKKPPPSAFSRSSFAGGFPRFLPLSLFLAGALCLHSIWSRRKKGKGGFCRRRREFLPGKEKERARISFLSSSCNFCKTILNCFLVFRFSGPSSLSSASCSAPVLFHSTFSHFFLFFSDFREKDLKE
jgi:hypothetical protein